jgi:hypothetical protein
MKDIKKTKRAKPLKTKGIKEVKPKVGRPSNQEKELEGKEKDFAIMKARGIPDNIIKDSLQLTRYLFKTYSEDERVKKEIVRLQIDIFRVDDREMWINMYTEILKESWQGMLRRIRDDKARFSQMEKIFLTGMMAMGVIENPAKEDIESITETKKIKRTPAATAKKQITYEDLFPDDDEDNIEDTNNEEELTHIVKKEKITRSNTE